VFFSAAQRLVSLPSPATGLSPKAVIRASSAEFAACGVTTVADPGPRPELIGAYFALARSRRLDTRLVVMPAIALLGAPEFTDELAGCDTGRPWCRFGPTKLFYDNFVMHKNAYMYEPYPGEPGNCGVARLSLAELQRTVTKAWSDGWPLGIHVTGDRALEEAACVMAEACRPIEAGRSHVIHAYFPTQTALRFLAESGVGAALQPGFLRAWGETLREFLGEERARRFLPLRTYLAAGVTAAGGSDAPVVHWNPFLGLAAAVGRRTLAGGALGEPESVAFGDALALYTTQAAKLLDMEEEIGSLERGKMADLVVVDRDVSGCTPSELAAVRPSMTVVGGRVVFNRRLRPSADLELA